MSHNNELYYLGIQDTQKFTTRNHDYSLGITAATWHQRLGHVSHDTIHKMHKRGLIEIQSEENPQVCQICPKAKMCRKPFKSANLSSSQNSKNPGEIICADLLEMGTASFGECRYMLIIKDMSSSFTRVYPLRKKSESAESLKEFSLIPKCSNILVCMVSLFN